MSQPEETERVLAATRDWLEKAVLGLDLCPFARPVYQRGQVRFVVSDATTPEALLADFLAELHHLSGASPDEVDTTLLIHPWALTDFLDFNDFLDVAEGAVAELGLEGEIQVASFHPEYHFEGSAPDDVENFTNRSPYPILHLLREESVERAVATFPDPESIYQKNIATLRRLGADGWRRLGVGRPEEEG